MTKSLGIRPKRVFFTQDEEDVLRARYPHENTADIARDIGRTVTSVYRKANDMGLFKTPEFMASKLAGRLDGVVGEASRFKPGHKTWNSGMKGWTAGGRSAETRFKKGNKPHTWNPIGHERTSKEGYIQRKLTDTGVTRRDYVNVHWIVWREAGRDIPPGHVLVFRDGNKTNFALDNLELITRQELMRRNTVHNYGKEIAQLVQLRGTITRQINKREGKTQ